MPPLIAEVAEYCYVALGSNFIPILFSAETLSPLTLGTHKPIIILPDSFLKITSEKTLTAALGHELAHIRRRDYGLNLLYELLSLFVSFHPAIKIVKRKINQTREMACDEIVAGGLLKPLDYARSLIKIAGFTSPASHIAHTLGVLNADILEKRIMKLIEISRGANTRPGKIRFLFVVMLLGVTATVTSIFSFGLQTEQTQEKPSYERNRDEETKAFKIELYSEGKRFASLTLNADNSERSSYGYAIYRVTKNQSIKTPEGEKVSAFQIVFQIDKGLVNVEVLALLEDPNTVSEAHPMSELKKQAVATFKIGENERVAISEMTAFGMTPFEIKVSKSETTLSDISTNNSGNVTENSSDSLSETAQLPKQILGNILNGKATKLVKPGYPPAAKAVKAGGAVNVQVTLDEQGNVISSSAISGHPLLRAASEEAARNSTFTPTMLEGIPVKITGVVVYNFVP